MPRARTDLLSASAPLSFIGHSAKARLWPWEATGLSSVYKRSEPQQKRRKRSGDEVRREALSAARSLLLEGGPANVTVSNVAKQIGMSHGNILHHFGSAGALQSALMGNMIADLSDAFGDVVTLLQKQPTGPQEVVDRVFDAFDKGGPARSLHGSSFLARWSILSQ